MSDGMIVPVKELGSVADLARLTAALLERGWSESDTSAVLGRNAERFLCSVL